MNFFRQSSIVLGLVAGTVGSAAAQTCFPMLGSTYPSGGQRGKTVEVTVTGADGTGAVGRSFFGASKVLFDAKGLSGTVVVPTPVPTNPNQPTVTLRVTVAAEAEPGIHEYRIMTPRGVSSVGLFVVGEEPDVVEAEPNNAMDKAQLVMLPATVNGKIQAVEDVDVYKFKAEAGQTVAFHVLCGRLQDKMHDLQEHADPMIAIIDATGRELTSNDDCFKADPYLVHTFSTAGEYAVVLRDVRYKGNPHWVYRLTMTNRPFVTQVYPMGVQRGQACEVELVGSGMGGMKRTSVQLPADMSLGRRLLQVPTPNGMTNAVPVYVSDFPAFLEAEDNDSVKSASALEVPGVANGRMDKEGDRDFFKFTAKRGVAYNFQLLARGMDSLLDSHLSVVNAEGRELLAVDDTTVGGRPINPDSTITGWTAPADGEYALAVRDLHNRGGENFGYVIVCQPQQQDYALRHDPDKAMIGPGGSYPIFVLLDRLGGFTGEVQVMVEGLPKGVTASPLTFLPGLTTGVIVLTAAAEAPMDATNVHVVGVAKLQRDGQPADVRRIAQPMQEIYFPGGGRGVYPVGMATVSVTTPQDILITVDKADLTLTQGETITVDVTVKRNNYTKPITVDTILRHLNGIHANPLPPGVTMELKIIGDNQDKTQIVLRANDTATLVTNWPIAVMGQVSLNFVVKTSYSTPPLKLTVLPRK